MNKICPICGQQFYDDTIGMEKDWCDYCTDEWNRIQREAIAGSIYIEKREDIKKDQYKALLEVFDMVYSRVALGKGQERHANGLPFDKQLICEITRKHGHGFTRGQMEKKLDELEKFTDKQAIINEMLDVIAYGCADVIVMMEESDD